VKGSGDDEESFDGTEGGWTGTASITGKEFTLSATRPLSAKPVLTEGDDAFHAVVFSANP